eukprot:234718-Prymnesium_polylepis.2
MMCTFRRQFASPAHPALSLGIGKKVPLTKKYFRKFLGKKSLSIRFIVKGKATQRRTRARIHAPIAPYNSATLVRAQGGWCGTGRLQV